MLLLLMLFPVAVYIAVLGWLNRRPHGFIVSGAWDFAGILFAASGFLMLGGPALLDGLSQSDAWRRFWILGKGVSVRDSLTQSIQNRRLWLVHAPADDRPLSEQLELARALLYISYFLLVLVGTALLLWRRRRLTAIYNVDPFTVETVLGNVLRRQHLSALQAGNVLFIRPDPTAPPPAEPLVPGALLVEKVTTLEVEASLGLAHVSLWWQPADSLLRRETEKELRLILAQQPAPGHVAGDWMLLVSSLLFFLMVIGAGVVLLLRLMKP